ncbi:MAG: sigma-54-dependent Fis family transcriptional regulator [Bdellovibrionales bacterium]|nr:sigma-54-dependent Fis family transcriptional regulator [Bdellovibrionales bacterium]
MINPQNHEAQTVTAPNAPIQTAPVPAQPLSYALQSVNPHFHELLALAETVAKSKATVMIQGESGSGKNILARYLFQKSQRSHKGFHIFRCKEAVLGSQDQDLKNMIEQSLGGTMLLTDITYLGATAQARLFQAIQDNLDIRWVVTTSRSLTQFVKGGDFREDLFYRLNVVSLKVPSLVDRMGDIELLAKVFVDRWAKVHARPVNRLSLEAIQLLNGHRWPGNIRELESVMERAVLLSQSEEIRARDIQIQAQPDRTAQVTEAAWKPGRTLDEIERNVILEALKYHGGNRTHTAKALGISIRTLRNKLAEYRVMGINA